MIITRLILKNFGIYAGINSFEFENKKPVVLIGGMNGRGKTTFLEAVLLAMYGANSFAYSESKYTTYGQYLKAYVNKTDGTLESYVELEFKVENDTSEKYLIRREWSGGGQRTREKISVKKNDEDNPFLTDNWAMFVENILPSGLANFFFFDGEKISELAVENTNAQMKASIKALLGITVLDILESDLVRIINRASKRSDNQLEMRELDLLRDKKNYAKKILEAADEKIDGLGNAIDDAKKRLEKANTEYVAKGGNIVIQRQDLYNQRNLLAVQIKQEEEHLANLAAGELPLLMVKDLLTQIQSQSEREHETKMMRYAIDKINLIYNNYASNVSKDYKMIKKFISYFEQKAEAEVATVIYDMSDRSLFQLNSLLQHELIKSKESTIDLLSECTKKQFKMDELDNYLSVDIDESVIADLYKRIKEIEQEIIDYEVELESELANRTSLNGEYIRTNSEYSHFVENLLVKLEISDDAERVLKYSHQAISVLGEYKIRLQRRKIDELADTMTDCYKKLANKKNLIDCIHMDAVTLDFICLNSEGIAVPKESLSAGEKQLMVISLLWALAICSKKKLPVIIDTPLSRLDSNHRISLITTYFPQASDQTIILSTDSEIDSYYYNIMKKDIGDEYTLIYNEKLKCSTIKKGYFVGDLT